jgi:hypothetical protein
MSICLLGRVLNVVIGPARHGLTWLLVDISTNLEPLEGTMHYWYARVLGERLAPRIRLFSRLHLSADVALASARGYHYSF